MSKDAEIVTMPYSFPKRIWAVIYCRNSNECYIGVNKKHICTLYAEIMARIIKVLSSGVQKGVLVINENEILASVRTRKLLVEEG